MCGIVITPAAVSSAPFLNSIGSRGPDGRGLLKQCGYNFAFVRLMIVADALAGAQPYEDDDVIVMFNGELYNWDRQNFKSEVQWLAKLAKDCRDFPRMLDGQFFAVVYYKARKEFIFARDPLGIVPGFFMRGSAGTHIFSEKLTPDAHEVKPGHIYRLAASGGLHIAPYWLPSLGSRALAPAALASEMGAAASKIRKHSDVPVSFALGGLDSMVMLKMLADMSALPDEIFTVGLRTEGDALYARHFCDWLKLDLREIVLTTQAARKVPTLVSMLSERLGEDLNKNEVKHWGAIRAALVAQAATNKVILTGDGADELFYGYPYFQTFSGHNLAFKGLASLNSMYRINLDRTDRAGMLFGKEYRPLYLDRFFMEWLLSHDRGKCKADLRNFAKYLGIPDEFIYRPKWGPDEVAAKGLIQ